MTAWKRWFVLALAMLPLGAAAWAAGWLSYSPDTDRREDQFIWKSDGTLGLSVSHAIRSADFPAFRMPRDVRVTVRVGPAIADYWQVREASTVWCDGDRRIELTPGPNRQPDLSQAPDTTDWELYGLSEGVYEFRVHLHRVREGLSVEQLRKAVARRGGLEFIVRPAGRETPVAELQRSSKRAM